MSSGLGGGEERDARDSCEGVGEDFCFALLAYFVRISCGIERKITEFVAQLSKWFISAYLVTKDTANSYLSINLLSSLFVMCCALNCLLIYMSLFKTHDDVPMVQNQTKVLVVPHITHYSVC